MTKGTFFGGVLGSPWGLGGGLYVDNQDRFYPQGYFGSPGLEFSAGYTPDLEGYLTGASVSASLGPGALRANLGSSGTSPTMGFGTTRNFGTPGAGATFGWGPYTASEILEMIRTMVQLGERTPDAAGETNGDIYDTGFRLPGAENASSSSSNASVTSRIPDGAASFEQRFENWASSPARVSSPTFDDRYGDWGSSPVPPQYQPPSSQSPGPTQTDYLDIRVLRRFVRAPDGSLVPAPLGVSNEP